MGSCFFVRRDMASEPRKAPSCCKDNACSFSFCRFSSRSAVLCFLRASNSLRFFSFLLNLFAGVSELISTCTMLPAVAHGCFGSLACQTIPVLAKTVKQVLGVHARSMAVDSRHRTDEEAHAYLDSLFLLKNSVALVTGGAGAVGAAVSLALAKCGADVVVTDLRATPEAKALIGRLQDTGSRAMFLECDVRDRTAVDDVMKEVERKHGHLEVLVANAGILGEMQKPHELSEDNWRNIFATNVDGVFHTVRAAYPLLKQSKHSKVVITSSIAANYGYGAQAAYCASKGALLPLAKSLALAWAPDGINVNVVLPGASNTLFTKKILNTPEKVQYMKVRQLAS